MKKKRGFTLVELLAVIVILAVILIIAMPKISDVIKNSKESSLETTAKLIASQAEKKYTENQVLDNSSTIKCSDVAKISNADYESCNITFDSKGNAKVTIVGKGKFEGMAVCNANKNNASISSDCSTDASYFTYEDTSSAEIVDVDKCKTFMQNPVGLTETQANTFCTTGSLTINNKTITVNDLANAIPEEGYSYETAGLKVETGDGISITGYNSGFNVEIRDKDKCITYFSKHVNKNDANTLCTGGKNDGLAIDYYVTIFEELRNDYEIAGLEVTYKNGGGSNVIIPKLINGKKVIEIAGYAFSSLGIVSVVVPNTIVNISEGAFQDNFLTSLTITNGVVSIGEDAFRNNELTKVVIPSSVTSIGIGAFQNNFLTSPTITNGVTSIGAFAFSGNQLTNVTIPASVESIGKGAFAIDCVSYNASSGICTKIGGNEYLSKIINKTGKSFDWDAIINDPFSGSFTFETGTVASSNKPNWNIEITK